MKSATISRISAIIALFLLCATASEHRLVYHFDHMLAEQRMALKKRPVSGKIALLEIDNKSLTAIGLWPWKRSIYGAIVEKTFAAGAEEIAFDIDFSASSSPEEDAAFQRALESAAGPVTLAVFQQHNISNRDLATLQTNRPIQMLEDNAWLATVNVLADSDGVIRHFPLAQEIDGELFPSLTSVMGGLQEIVEGTFIVDYGIDATTIPTYSIIDLLQGRLPDDALAGKKVLVGAGAAELRDTLTVPVAGMMSGPKLQILAAENLLLERGLAYADKAWQFALGAFVFLPVLLIALSRRLNTFIKFAFIALLSFLIEAAAFLIYQSQPVLLATGLVQIQLLLSGITLFLFEIRFKDFMLTMSHRHNRSLSDLLETIVVDSFSGILVVDEQGRIIEVSQQAIDMLQDLGYSVQKGDTIERHLPPEMASLVTAGLASDQDLTTKRHLATLQIERADTIRYFEYSLTPSIVTSEAIDEDEEDNQIVATLLFHDVTRAREEQKRLAYLADHDLVTDLLNASGFCRTVDDRMIAMGQEDALIIACQATRIDKITQSLGIEYSDQLLREIAKRLEALALFDVVGCTEQKEFLLCKFGAVKDDMNALTEIVRDAFEAQHSVRGHNILLRSLIGVADFREGGLLAEEVSRAATVALHRTEETGDEALFYTSDLAADVLHRRVLEREIIDAIDREEFELHYQPQANLKTHEIIGCEALARWNHRDLGHIRPDLFIPILEDTGLIVEFGRWLLETACTEAMLWDKPVTVAVNISAVQFTRSDILADIRKALEISGLPKERLHVEITESLFISDVDTIIETLNAIRAEGIKIALDDFGTGYSSLSYIHQFPLDKIKIDRAFVKDLPHSMSSMAVINAVQALARGFEMDIVAEGMETEAQTEVLRLAGCHIGQGYYFGKPMPTRDFNALLETETIVSTPHQEQLVS